jgi:predicted permease
MSAWSKFRFRVRSLFLKRRLDAEMAEEMRLHLELRAERNRASGMPVDEADFAARRSFGGVEQLKERARERRGWLWLEQAGQDLRFALRQLVRAPLFTAAAVVSLALGIGLNTAVFSIINTLFYQTIRGVPEPHRVLIFNEGNVSPAGYDLLREQTSDVASITAGRGSEAVLGAGGIGRRERVALVAGNYFTVLGVRPALGRLFTSATGAAGETAEPVAVLGHAYWRNQLESDPAVLGRPLRINGQTFTIIGVADRDFHGPGPEGPPLWVPLGCAPLIETAGRPASASRLAVIGRLRPEVTLGMAQAAVDVTVQREPLVFGEKTRLRLSQGREDWRGVASPEKRIEFILVTTVPLVVVAGLLWIACSNVGNLLLARAVQRQKEIAIRVASGATRGRLIRMMMSEGLVLALFGGAAGIWVSGRTLDFVFATLSNFSAFSVQVDLRVLVYTTAVSLAASLLFALAPALQASKTDVNAALKGESSRPALRGSRLRAFFLASQIASSVALLIVAGTFVKSLLTAASAGQARQLEYLAYAQLPATERAGLERAAYYQAARERALTVPGVEAATLVEQGGSSRRRFARPGDLPPVPGEAATEVDVQRIDAAFFPTVGAVLLRGAGLTAAAPAGVPQPVVINDALARRFWSADTALGQPFTLAAQACEVVGLVNDNATQPVAYLYRPPDGAERLALLVRTRTSAENHTAALASALRGTDPAAGADVPVVAPLRELAFRTQSEMARIACFIGALALTLAAAGIYGSTAFSTGQRSREIGVRMALGATRPDVLRLVLGSAPRVVGWGSAAGLVLALVGLRLLFNLLPGQLSFDVGAIGVVLVFFALVALTACLIPAYRATTIDPLVTLRRD